MTSAERGGRPPGDLDHSDLYGLADVDEDSAPQVRRFLEAIAQSRGPARTAGPAPKPATTRVVDRERLVMRFAWTCEELNVAFADMDPSDPETRRLLSDHGVGLTLDEVRAKAAALSAAIAGPPAG
jgi:hypothetical protein